MRRATGETSEEASGSASIRCITWLIKQYPHGFDYIIDTTANPKLISRSLYLLKRGGTFVNYGFQNNVKVAEQVQIDRKLFVTRQLSDLGTTFQHFKFPPDSESHGGEAGGSGTGHFRDSSSG